MTGPGERKTRSVALTYERGADSAPRVSAKGEGPLAEAILRVARQNGIPVENDPILADALYRFPEGDPIPPELYLAVAEVYAFLIRTRRIALEAENPSGPTSPGG